MGRSLVAAAIVRAAREESGLRVEGPDEDLFTLAVASIRAVQTADRPDWTSRAGRLDLSAALPESDDWAIREAFGWPRGAIHHHVSGAAGWSTALAAAARAPANEGAAIVAVVEGSVRDPTNGRLRSGAIATAYRFAEGPGVELLGHAERGHPSWRRPEANEWVDAAERSLGAEASPPRGRLVFVAEQVPPVLANVWLKRHPGLPAMSASLAPPSVGAAPGASAALGLRELLLHLAEGETGVLAHTEPDRTIFVGLRRTGEIPWIGPWASPEPSSLATAEPGKAPSEGESGPDVSEGAYVPRPTYLANLPSRWRLAADRCDACGGTTFPVRGICRHCGEENRLTRLELPRDGLLVEAVTTVAPGAQPTEFDELVGRRGAYDVVIARAAPDVRVTLQVADAPAGSVRIGDTLSAELRQLYRMEGEWRYGLKAVRGPALSPAA